MDNFNANQFFLSDSSLLISIVGVEQPNQQQSMDVDANNNGHAAADFLSLIKVCSPTVFPDLFNSSQGQRSCNASVLNHPSDLNRFVLSVYFIGTIPARARYVPTFDHAAQEIPEGSFLLNCKGPLLGKFVGLRSMIPIAEWSAAFDANWQSHAMLFSFSSNSFISTCQLSCAIIHTCCSDSISFCQQW